MDGRTQGSMSCTISAIWSFMNVPDLWGRPGRTAASLAA